MRLNFEWDKRKAAINKRKHGVSFELAARVFHDPNRIEAYDDLGDHREDRWITVGMVDPILLAVVYTVRGAEDQAIRLISARKANDKERRQYGKIYP
jgi:uncharacterized protein